MKLDFHYDAELLSKAYRALGKLHDLWASAESFYLKDAYLRKYHDIAHALEVTSNVVLLSDELKASTVLAALWHDAIYFPGAGSDANERCSAAALQNTYDFGVKLGTLEGGLGQALAVSEAATLIRSTSIEYHLSANRLDGELAILLDADLGALALPYDKFLAKQRAVIEENGGTFEKHKQQSSAFLQQFLKVRPAIYHTDKARELWEDSARKNILRYLDETS